MLNCLKDFVEDLDIVTDPTVKHELASDMIKLSGLMLHWLDNLQNDVYETEMTQYEKDRVKEMIRQLHVYTRSVLS